MIVAHSAPPRNRANVVFCDQAQVDDLSSPRKEKEPRSDSTFLSQKRSFAAACTANRAITVQIQRVGRDLAPGARLDHLGQIPAPDVHDLAAPVTEQMLVRADAAVIAVRSVRYIDLADLALCHQLRKVAVHRTHRNLRHSCLGSAINVLRRPVLAVVCDEFIHQLLLFGIQRVPPPPEFETYSHFRIIRGHFNTFVCKKQ